MKCNVAMGAAAALHAVSFGKGPPGTSAIGTSVQCSGAEVLLIVLYNAFVPAPNALIES